MQRTPKAITPAIADFCRALAPGQQPAYVAVVPAPHGRRDDCFVVVAEQIRTCGGSIVYGWHITEWRHTFLEAVFHAIWKDSDSSLVDVTPKPTRECSILFLPDPHRRYDGRQVNNRRRALRPSPAFAEFDSAANDEFEFLNRGARARQLRVELTPPEHRTLRQIQWRRFRALLRLTISSLFRFRP